MKQLISDIKARLAEKVTALRYIDEDWGQLDYYASDAPVKWPCALITITQAQWSNQGRLTQTGIADVSIRIADLKLSNTNPKASVSQRAAANTIFDVMKDSFASLHGWTASSANGPLTRTQTRKVNREDGIREFEVIYSVQLIDTDAKPVLTAYPMTPEKITFQMGLIAPGSGELTPPWQGGGTIIPPDPVPVGGEVYTTAEKTKLAGIAEGANNYTHPNHTGEVTSNSDGAIVINQGVITHENIHISLTQQIELTGIEIDWAVAAIFRKSINGPTEFTFLGLKLNKVITLILTGGNYAVAMPNYCKRISGSYMAGFSNYVQLHCTNDNDSEVWYTISQGGV